MSFSRAHLLPYNQLTTLRFHIQVLVLLKIAYFSGKSNHHVYHYLATSIHRNNTSDFDKVSSKLYQMEMDIGVKN